MTWSDTPPSEPGWYWVKSNSIGKEFTWEIDQQGLGTLWHASELQFGQRIPSNAQLAELQRKAEELDRINAAWGLTKGTMPNAETDTTLG